MAETKGYNSGKMLFRLLLASTVIVCCLLLILRQYLPYSISTISPIVNVFLGVVIFIIFLIVATIDTVKFLRDKFKQNFLPSITIVGLIALFFSVLFLLGLRDRAKVMYIGVSDKAVYDSYEVLTLRADSTFKVTGGITMGSYYERGDYAIHNNRLLMHRDGADSIQKQVYTIKYIAGTDSIMTLTLVELNGEKVESGIVFSLKDISRYDY